MGWRKRGERIEVGKSGREVVMGKREMMQKRRGRGTEK
jgi:hypothetical protein